MLTWGPTVLASEFGRVVSPGPPAANGAAVACATSSSVAWVEAQQVSVWSTKSIQNEEEPSCWDIPWICYDLFS